MKFDELDKKMRVFETAHDHQVLPGLYMAARLDGRGFTRLTKETLQFKAPFDEGFRDMMVETVSHLMGCGFNFLYGYTQSDEISLLFADTEHTFSRKLRKLNSVLAGEASAKFSLLAGTIACFDCRISQLPTKELVIDYFRWRNEDAHRNALNSHCYWKLRQAGVSQEKATAQLKGLSRAEKNQLLETYKINFNHLPLWQKRGVGVYWQYYEKEGYDPQKKTKETAVRRKLHVEPELPAREEYDAFIAGLMDKRGHEDKRTETDPPDQAREPGSIMKEVS